MSHSRISDPSINQNLKHIIHCHKKSNFCDIQFTSVKSIWLLSTYVSHQSISNCKCIVLVNLNRVKVLCSESKYILTSVTEYLLAYIKAVYQLAKLLRKTCGYQVDERTDVSYKPLRVCQIATTK